MSDDIKVSVSLIPQGQEKYYVRHVNFPEHVYISMGFYVNGHRRFAFKCKPMFGEMEYIIPYELENRFNGLLAARMMMFFPREKVDDPEFKFKLSEDEWKAFADRWDLVLDHELKVTELNPFPNTKKGIANSKAEFTALENSLSYNIGVAQVELFKVLNPNIKLGAFKPENLEINIKHEKFINLLSFIIRGTIRCGKLFTEFKTINTRKPSTLLHINNIMEGHSYVRYWYKYLNPYYKIMLEEQKNKLSAVGTPS